MGTIFHSQVLAQSESFTSTICNTAGPLHCWGCIHETPRSNLEAAKRPGNQPAGHPVMLVGKMSRSGGWISEVELVGGALEGLADSLLGGVVEVVVPETAREAERGR